MECGKCNARYVIGIKKCVRCNDKTEKMEVRPGYFHLICCFEDKNYYLEMDETKTVRTMKREFLRHIKKEENF